MNNYGVEWVDENGKPQWKEAQYLSDLLQVVKELLGKGVETMTVCRLKNPE